MSLKFSYEFFYSGVFGSPRSPGGAVVNMLPIALHAFFIVACTFARFHTFIIVNNYRVGQKSDTSRTYMTLYERYHFFGPPGISTLVAE